MCQRFVYDDHHQVVRQLDVPVLRPPGTPTPCWNCPKQSPAHAAGCERDIDRIRRLLRLYYQIRATAGRCLSDEAASDPRLVRDLAIVDTLVRRSERLVARDQRPVGNRRS